MVTATSPNVQIKNTNIDYIQNKNNNLIMYSVDPNSNKRIKHQKHSPTIYKRKTYLRNNIIIMKTLIDEIIVIHFKR